MNLMCAPSAIGNNVAAEIALIAANATATLPVVNFENLPTAGIIMAAANGSIPD